MKYNHLNVPSHWKNYWTRYPEGHTILEALISWVSQVDSMVDNQNKLNTNVEQFRNEIDVFIGKFDGHLQDEVTQTLSDWQNSGFLDVVINEALQTQMDDLEAETEQTLTAFNTQMQQTEQSLNTQLQQKASKDVLERKLKERVVNISFDDFQHALNDITVNAATYTSIFNNGTFSHLKHLHDTYGAKFSLFVFTNDQYNLSNTTTKFASEFSEHSDWLQFGFHGRDPQTLYNQTTLEEFKSDYDNFLSALNKFAPDNLCRHIRLSSFYGTSTVMNELRTVYGIKGVFTADDDRLSYDLTTEEAKQIKVDGVLRKNYLNYIESTFRLDNFTATNVRGNLEQVKHRNAISVYFHDSNFNVKKDMLTEAVKWLVSNGYHFSSFDDINDIRHYKPLLNYIPFSLSENWSLRPGNTFKVRKDGNKVHVQGQLIKNADITAFEQCVSFESSLAPEYPMVIDVKNFQDSGTSLETIVGVLDANSQLKIGWRDKNATPGNRVIAVDFSYYIS